MAVAIARKRFLFHLSLEMEAARRYEDLTSRQASQDFRGIRVGPAYLYRRRLKCPVMLNEYLCLPVDSLDRRLWNPHGDRQLVDGNSRRDKETWTP